MQLAVSSLLNPELSKFGLFGIRRLCAVDGIYGTAIPRTTGIARGLLC